MKIYNEIVIDMNPESSTFEETIHEDSFEYSGDMMLMYGHETYVAAAIDFSGDTVEEQHIQLGDWIDPERYGRDYGMESLTYESVMGMTRTQLTDYVIGTIFGGQLPSNISRDHIMNTLEDYFPQLGEVAEEEMGFLATQYGGEGVSFAESLAGQKAGLAKQQDIYQLQGAASQLGQPGVGMRQQIAGRGAIGRGFETAQESYGLAGQQAGLAYETGVYGLEQEVEKQWEQDFEDLFKGLSTAG